jgi:pimeloyl-ACP methyl ester carboxylesterase
MDYHRPLSVDQATLESPPTVNIALVLLPGLNHTMENGNFSESSLLINPGGPGGSGVAMVLSMGGNLRRIVGEDQDILGFDPRGVSFSTPVADCFAFPAFTKSSAAVVNTPSQDGDDNQEGLTDFDRRRGDFHRLTWRLSRSETGIVNSSSTSLRELDYAARVEAKLCQSKDEMFGENSILRHVDTPNVARDMLSIIDAWQDWRKSFIFRAEQKQSEDGAPLQERKARSVTSIEEKDVGPAKLKFWGFSYGTLLGATFAAMFPDRVGRMVLDGVVDADHYVSPIWEESIHDTDRIISKFLEFCNKAQGKCALWRPQDTIGSLQARYTRIMDGLKRKHGLPILQTYTKTPIVFTYSDLKSSIFQSLYSPVQLFPYIAEILAVIESEDESQLGRMLAKINSFLEYYQICPPEPRIGFPPGEAQRAIMCSDKRYPVSIIKPCTAYFRCPLSVCRFV